MNDPLHMKIDEAFTIIGDGVIGGGLVRSGELRLGANVTVTRGTQKHAGTVTQLRRFHTRPESVPAGLECGVCVSGWKFAPGDIITDVQE